MVRAKGARVRARVRADAKTEPNRRPRRPTPHVADFFPRVASLRNSRQAGGCGGTNPKWARGAGVADGIAHQGRSGRARESARDRDVLLVARRARERRWGIATRRGGRAERRGRGSSTDATGRGSGACGGRIRARSGGDPRPGATSATRRWDRGTSPTPRARSRGAPRGSNRVRAPRALWAHARNICVVALGKKPRRGSRQTRVRVQRRPARGSRRRDARDETCMRTKRSGATGGSGDAPECPSRARRQRLSRCTDKVAESPTSDREGRTAETLPR